MSDLGNLLAGLVSYGIGLVGDKTAVNGITLERATWNETAPGKVQAFIDKSLWGSPIYDVTVPGSCLGAPVSVMNGSLVNRKAYGWSGTVVRVEAPGVNDTAANVTLLVMLTPSDTGAFSY